MGDCKMYQYKIINDDKFASGTSKILNSSLMSGEGSAQFRGALLTLFGEPFYKTKNAENAYQYIIEATDKDNNKWILTAYEGPSGPAIGGDNRKEYIRYVARDLLNLIENTRPTDFNEEIIYGDFNNIINYGCKDGICYFNERKKNLIDYIKDLFKN